MEELILDERTLDELYPTSSDFFEAFRAKSARERADLIWRMPKDPQ
jgi:hypothetical protein